LFAYKILPRLRLFLATKACVRSFAYPQKVEMCFCDADMAWIDHVYIFQLHTCEQHLWCRRARTDPQYLCMCKNAADVYACTSTAVWALARVIDASWCICMHKVQLFKC
jgi:hypothetical protein